MRFLDLNTGAHGDFGGPGTTTRVYLSNFSAVSFLLVKLILKIFVIIACCALLQDCFRRKRRVAGMPGTLGAADAFDILPLRRRALGSACGAPTPRRSERGHLEPEFVPSNLLAPKVNLVLWTALRKSEA